jgi:hypothetical protein
MASFIPSDLTTAASANFQRSKADIFQRKDLRNAIAGPIGFTGHQL